MKRAVGVMTFLLAHGAHTFGAALCICLLASAASAEPYPQEVRDAFSQECVQSGGPEAVCACVLDRMERNISLDALAAQDFTEDQITSYTLECMGAAPAAAAESSEPTSWGPECAAYVQDVEALCSGELKPELVAAACDAGRQSLEQMRVVPPAQDSPAHFQSLEETCREGRETVKTVRTLMH